MKNKKLMIAVIALVLVFAALAAVYFTSRPAAQEGSKAFTVTVIHADGSEKKFDYRTDAEKLGAFLEEKGIKLEAATIDMLGTAESITVNKDNTTIVSGRGAKENIQARVGQIKAQIEKTTSDYDREKLQERLAKLAGGVAVIKVGAATEVEMKEKKDRVDDALHATRAAVEEGIVAGGGVALIRAADAVDALSYENADQKTGASIIRRAIEEPLRQIVTNAGQEASVVANEVRNGSDNYGYNAGTEQYGDMIEMGILDPTKVTRSALQYAASIAGLMLTTECMVADAPRKDDAPAAPAMNNGWGPVQPGMSSANGPKGTVFQPGNGGNNNPLSAPGATVYMPSK